MDTSTADGRYDGLIVGGGPAGLSAAINLARACRTVAVFDRKRPGRSDWAQVNHNYLGFPEGISIVELCARGRRQAERFGATFVDAEVSTLARDNDGFVATGGGCAVQGRGVIFATGVEDRWVTFPGYEDYIGRSMHWCITCDGYEMRGRRVVVVGNDEHAAEMAMQMLAFGPAEVKLLTNSGALGIRPSSVEATQERGIRVVVGRIVGARARGKGQLETLVMENRDMIALDHLFSVQGAEPNTALARSLGVDLTPDGYIATDVESRTSVPGVYAAGDTTRLFSHQVTTAAHEGATAAQALAYDLFRADSDMRSLHSEVREGS